MSSADAAKLLDLPADASPEQLEARFHELRTKLEEKIGKAPTPGLKAKYRESLEEITTAFETLTLAADSSSLPVIQKQGAGSKEQGGGVPSPRAGSDSGLRSQVSGLPTRRKSGGKELVLVAVIAVVVLAAGGWFVMKNRAENAEKARIAEEARLTKEADAKAEQTRVEKMTGELRSVLAEARILWETAEREERDADRRLTDLKSEQRSLRDPKPDIAAALQLRINSAQRHANWLRDYLQQHPLKLARAKMEELLQARDFGNAADLKPDVVTAMADLKQSLEVTRSGEAVLRVASELVGTEWELRDDTGQVQRGRAPQDIGGLLFARYEFSARYAPFPEQTVKLDLVPGRTASLELKYPHGVVQLANLPADARILANLKRVEAGAKGEVALPLGPVTVSVQREGYLPRGRRLEVAPGQQYTVEFTWVRTDSAAMLFDEYLRLISPQPLLDQVLKLNEVQIYAFRAGVLNQERLAALLRPLVAEVGRSGTPAEQAQAHFYLAWMIQFIDAAAARPLLEQAVSLFSGLEREERLKLANRLVPTASVWKLAPTVAQSHFARLDADLRATASRQLWAYLGFCYLGDDGAADDNKAYLMSLLTADERKRAEARFVSARQDALLELAAFPYYEAAGSFDFDALRRLLIDTPINPENAGLIRGLAELFFSHGLDEQVLALDLRRNWREDPTLSSQFQKTGRLDLLERFVREGRMHDKDRKSHYQTLAQNYAQTGNATKARDSLALAGDPGTNGDRGTRALTLALLGDRVGAVADLDELEKSKSVRNYRSSEMITAARLLGDTAREKRLLERHSQRVHPGLLATELTIAGRLEPAAATLAGAKEDNYRDYFWLSEGFYFSLLRHPGRRADAPWLDLPGSEERLVLQYLALAAGRAQAPRLSLPSPWFDQVPPYEISRGLPFFSPEAIALGSKTGRASVSVMIDATGKPGAITTISESGPSFANQLSQSIPQWKFLPGLVKGVPAAMPLVIEYNFRLKE